MAEHKRDPSVDYCSVCGLLEKDWIAGGCSGKPVLSVAPPATLTEVERFNADPLAWIQEWNDKNGKVILSRAETVEEATYIVYLWVEGQGRPISTGIAPTLPHAFQNAIKGLDGLAHIG